MKTVLLCCVRFYGHVPVCLVKDDIFDAVEFETHFNAEMNESTRSCNHNILRKTNRKIIGQELKFQIRIVFKYLYWKVVSK